MICTIFPLPRFLLSVNHKTKFDRNVWVGVFLAWLNMQHLVNFGIPILFNYTTEFSQKPSLIFQVFLKNYFNMTEYVNISHHEYEFITKYGDL